MFEGRFKIDIARDKKKQIIPFPGALYVLDVTFQKSICSSGYGDDGKGYYVEEHKLHGYEGSFQ